MVSNFDSDGKGNAHVAGYSVETTRTEMGTSVNRGGECVGPHYDCGRASFTP